MIACLDVRSNDKGDLVVTKGDQYDVREQSNENEVCSNFCFNVISWAVYFVKK